jgi:hypothetical protein
MKRFLISTGGLVIAALLSFSAGPAAADRAGAAGDAGRDHASAARDSARDRASAARDVASAAREGARDHASAARDAARDRASAARDVANAASDDARDRASAARDQARDSVSEHDREVIDVVEREVFVDRNGDRSYTSLGAWIEDLQRSWSDTGSQRSDGELSAQTSVAVGNARSTQTARTSTSGGEASISLSTTVSSTENGRSVTQVQRASASTNAD